MSQEHAVRGGRHEGIDALRGILLLYVVAFWHGLGFAPAHGWHVNVFTTQLTSIALGTFLLLSGYLAGLEWLKLERRGVGFGERSRRIVWSRVRKLYPLYLLAVVVFWAVGISDTVEAIKAALLVSSVLKPAPETLWFVLALLTLIALAPVLLWRGTSGRGFLGRVLAALLLATIYAVTTRLLDSRIVFYLPTFALGLWWGRSGISAIESRTRATLAAILLLGAICYGIERSHTSFILTNIRNVLVLFSASGLIFAATLKARSLGRAYIAVEYFAYAGYAAYLFHRPIYIDMAQFMPTSMTSQALYIELACVPVIFAVAGALQKGSDMVLSWFATREPDGSRRHELPPAPPASSENPAAGRIFKSVH